MARDEGAGPGNILLAFLLGAVSGAAFALLYPRHRWRDARVLSERTRAARPRSGEPHGREGAANTERGRDTISSAIDRGHEAIPINPRSQENA